jgi:hypothetical protein
LSGYAAQTPPNLGPTTAIPNEPNKLHLAMTGRKVECDAD